jgi:Tfp pilus assembly protein PilO
MNCPEEYDIKLGDMSLKDTLAAINKWLPILKPNVKLEADFEQLKQLREQYEALEKELMGKSEMWDLLKKE